MKYFLATAILGMLFSCRNRNQNTSSGQDILGYPAPEDAEPDRGPAKFTGCVLLAIHDNSYTQTKIEPTSTFKDHEFVAKVTFDARNKLRTGYYVDGMFSLKFPQLKSGKKAIWRRIYAKQGGADYIYEMDENFGPFDTSFKVYNCFMHREPTCYYLNGVVTKKDGNKFDFGFRLIPKEGKYSVSRIEFSDLKDNPDKQAELAAFLGLRGDSAEEEDKRCR